MSAAEGITGVGFQMKSKTSAGDLVAPAFNLGWDGITAGGETVIPSHHGVFYDTGILAAER
jgi:hypothetical protein